MFPAPIRIDGCKFSMGVEQVYFYSKIMLCFPEGDLKMQLIAECKALNTVDAVKRFKGRLREFLSPDSLYPEIRVEARKFEENWVRERVVWTANFLKYFQNPHLREKLVSTDGSLLVEANGNDSYWGVRLSPEAI